MHKKHAWGQRRELGWKGGSRAGILVGKQEAEISARGTVHTCQGNPRHHQRLGRVVVVVAQRRCRRSNTRSTQHQHQHQHLHFGPRMLLHT